MRIDLRAVSRTVGNACSRADATRERRVVQVSLAIEPGVPFEIRLELSDFRHLRVRRLPWSSTVTQTNRVANYRMGAALRL